MAADIPTRILDYLNSIFARYLTRFIGALIILLIGIIIGRVLGKFVKRILHEFEFDTFIRKTTSIKISLEELISHLLEYIIYLLSIVYALSKVGLVSTVFQLIALVVIIFIALSIILGLKDFIPNMLSGIRMQQKRYFNEGDTILMKNKENEIEGRIVNLNLIETVVETKKGDIIHIPNSLLSSSIVKKVKSRKK